MRVLEVSRVICLALLTSNWEVLFTNLVAGRYGLRRRFFNLAAADREAAFAAAVTISKEIKLLTSVLSNKTSVHGCAVY